MSTPDPPFKVDQVVRPTKELLEHYPLWLDHDRPCKIASIQPSISNKGVFQSWAISIIFSDESARYLVSPFHLEAV